ncbi:MAG: hypoxanthine phosphoribosyltransferase [Oscillospiraceae bacterium]|nr:hypoxanthine phosphoribosyltransferase [Oscillospiraceae bacterium]
MDGISRILYDQATIASAVKRVGAIISEEYRDKNPLLIGVLKGSFIFMADLVRVLDIPCEMEFMVAKSYGQRTQSSGVVEILKDINTDINGRDVIIIEDILDTANTLFSITEVLKARNPASIKICVFLDKNIERKVPVTADYKCFDIENEFVVGYGLDYAEKYRNLPYLGVLGV